MIAVPVVIAVKVVAMITIMITVVIMHLSRPHVSHVVVHGPARGGF